LRRRLEGFLAQLGPGTKVLLIFPAIVYFSVVTIIRYKATVAFLMKQGKIQSLCNFMLAKLFVREEGGTLCDPVLRLFPRVCPLPWSIEVEVTTRCDKRCLICEHTYWNEPSRDLSFSDFKKIVDQFPYLAWFNPTGEGEPFLNKDFPRMISYLKSKSIFVFFNDSFDKVGEKRARGLIEIGIDRIEISMQGATKETYEKIMVGHNFNKVIDNIKTMVRLKKELGSPLPEICFHYIITTLNVGEIPQFIELMYSLGGKDAFGPGSFVNFSGLLEFKEVKYLITEVPQEIIEHANKKAEQLNIGIMWTHYSHDQRQKPSIKNCVAWSQPYVLMGGDVISCCGVLMSNRRPFLRKHSFGNIFEQSFKQIWALPRYKKFRRMIPRQRGKVPVFCDGCRVYDTSIRQKRYGVHSKV